ncbi:MAG TPA: PstS family phosphate ABC transporter substrate-binding protein [Gaiellaceae bacterium]
MTHMRGGNGETSHMPSRSLLVVGLIAALLLAGCGRSDNESKGGSSGDLSGRISADGSSTVGPFVTTAAEDFQKEQSRVQVTVGISGTGGGFERFCRGETDLSDASRPIEADERAICGQNGVEFIELQVANDGIAIVVNKQNDWAKCLSVEQLQEIWKPGSKVDSWRDLEAKFPDEKLKLAGPGTDSGTFDFFTKEINGEEGASRTDYQPSENDNVIVQAVAGDKGGLGYFGLSYAEQNSSKLRTLEVDGGKGCVAPTRSTVQSGKYTPLSRPLFVYTKRDALERPEVKAFLDFMLDHQTEIAGDIFVPLTTEQLAKAHTALEQT